MNATAQTSSSMKIGYRPAMVSVLVGLIGAVVATAMSVGLVINMVGREGEATAGWVGPAALVAILSGLAALALAFSSRLHSHSHGVPPQGLTFYGNWLGGIAVVMSAVAVVAAWRDIQIGDVYVFKETRFMLGPMIESALEVLGDAISRQTRILADGIEISVDWLVDHILLGLPGPVTIAIITVMVIWVTRQSGITVFTILGLLLLWNLGLWVATMETLALVLIATVTSVIIGIPIGILSALSGVLNRMITPILDFMQTLPPFVYLIPALPFFGPGTPSAWVTTVVFSIPPTIRLTTLGIRQVPNELVEAADAFGSTRMQKLVKLQLPIATTTIRAGINQTIMLSLSMVVIAALIGAGGLGREVWQAIQRNQVGLGFESGIAIVVLAIVLDRFMQNIHLQNKKVGGGA